MNLKVSDRISIPETEFDLAFAGSSGPGGQNVNKTNTKAVMYWSVSTSPSLPPDVRERFMARYHHRITSEGTLIITSDRFRDQRRNASDCMEKLSEMLAAVATPPKKRKPTKPTRSSKEKRIQTKKDHSSRKSMRRKPDY